MPGQSNSGRNGLINSSYYRNQRILFQKNTVTNDEYENQIQTWVDYFECWAYANTIQASESNDDTPEEHKNVIFETRYCPELAVISSTEYRIIFNSEAYDITAVDHMNYQNDTLKFQCSIMNPHLQPEV